MRMRIRNSFCPHARLAKMYCHQMVWVRSKDSTHKLILAQISTSQFRRTKMVVLKRNQTKIMPHLTWKRVILALTVRVREKVRKPRLMWMISIMIKRMRKRRENYRIWIRMILKVMKRKMFREVMRENSAKSQV